MTKQRYREWVQVADALAVATLYSELGQSSQLVINSRSGAGELVTIRVDEPGPGTFTLDSETSATVSLPGGERWDTRPSGSGAVTITTLSETRAVGTFSFTARDQIGSTQSQLDALTVTEGDFNLPLTLP